MMWLSDEILLTILELLYYSRGDFTRYGKKRDLLACRATCRRLRDLGQSLAFTHISFMHDEEGYTKLLEISKSVHLCHTIRYITCSFENLEARLTPEQFARFMGLNTVRTQREPNDRYEEYHCRYQSRQYFESNNVHIASLVAALPRFGNLHTVRILEDVRHISGNWESLDRVSTNSHAGLAVFEALVSTLFVMELGIERLVLGSSPGDSPPLIGILQGLNPAKQNLYQKAFGSLNYLKLVLPTVIYHEDGGFGQRHKLNYNGISALIWAAPLLNELQLVFDMPSQDALPSRFLKSLQIPRLRTLQLVTIAFQDPLCLARFFSKHATALKRVELSDLSLETGSWETVFTEMRDVLMLNSIILSGEFSIGGSLTGGITLGSIQIDEYAELECEFGHRWVDIAGEACRVRDIKVIESFIQRKTDDNPFDALRLSMHMHNHPQD